jgi:hypothetical protein
VFLISQTEPSEQYQMFQTSSTTIYWLFWLLLSPMLAGWISCGPHLFGLFSCCGTVDPVPCSWCCHCLIFWDPPKSQGSEEVTLEKSFFPPKAKDLSKEKRV